MPTAGGGENTAFSRILSENWGILRGNGWEATERRDCATLMTMRHCTAARGMTTRRGA